LPGELRQPHTGQLLQLTTLCIVEVRQRGGGGLLTRRADPLGGGGTSAGEDDGDRAGVPPRPAGDVARGLQPIDQPHRPGMRETDQLAQLSDRPARLPGFMQRDQCGRPGVAQTGGNRRLRRRSVRHGEGERTHQIDQAPVVAVSHGGHARRRRARRR
jgi:hypothetical protein